MTSRYYHFLNLSGPSRLPAALRAALTVALWAACILHPLLAGEPQPATWSERKVFESDLDVLLEQKDLLPYEVDDVINSLTDTVTIQFECTDGFRVGSVSLKMTTRLIRWDPKLAVNGEAIRPPANAAGFYVWRPLIRIHKRKKAIVASNMIMLNTQGMALNRVPLPFEEASLLYHELLHGQLLLDTIKGKEWQGQSCVCQFDAEAQDGAHSKIPTLIHRYLESLAERAPAVYSLDIPPQPQGNNDGSFRIALTTLETPTRDLRLDTFYYYPERSNVEPESFSIVVEEKTLVAAGRLVDKSNRGFMLVHLKSRR